MSEAGFIQVEVVRAWPRRHESRTVRLPAMATVADALHASGFEAGGEDDGEVACAVFGQRTQRSDRLQDGDRLEVLRPLEIDPKDARRRRARKEK